MEGETINIKAEKISGALDFIYKILELKGLIEVTSYVDRILKVNRLFQPILIQEKGRLNLELKNLRYDLVYIKKEFNELEIKNNDYQEKIKKIKADIKNNNDPKLPYSELEKLIRIETDYQFPEYFNTNNPENSFVKMYNTGLEKIKKTETEIVKTEFKLNEMIKYNEKIDQFLLNS